MATKEPIRLSDEDRKQLEALEDEIEWLRGEIERAKIVGIDIKDLEEEFNKTVEMREKLLKYY